ncbi:ParA family protein [Undibacterium sp. SXout11W]|uniref:ParA family protein n=1 Tax=Undibacterium sp. SXout11W TaxID=3413050 RepID=UPI003BF0F857
MLTYAIWNNKGGTGKTSLTFQAVCRYAQNNPNKRILTIDMCPQANMSELLLGGLQNNGSGKLLQRQGATPRCSIGGYFDVRMPSAHQVPKFNAMDFITQPHLYNSSIPKTIDLVCGDPLLELQAIAMNTLANIQLPTTNTWLAVIDWLRDFLNQVNDRYDLVFIDTNPSFSMYTQIALAAADRIVLPVMADDSSRRAIQNAFSLIYGLKLPSQVYKQYTFANQMKAANRALPKVHLILKNRLTQYMGSASAYAAVLAGIDSDLNDLINSYPEYFTFENVSDGVVDIRDFGTTGVVAFARGIPFAVMPTGRLSIGSHRVQVALASQKQMITAIDGISNKL